MVPAKSSSALFLVTLASGASGQELPDDPPPPQPVWEELLRLRARLEVLERGEAPSSPVEQAPSIDLSGEEVAAFEGNHDHVLSRPWYENLRFSGYGAFTYLDTGGAGTTEDGSFVVQEASLFLDAQVWERTSMFTEVWLSRYQYGNGFVLGECYLQFTDLLGSDASVPLAVKAGRFEIPFGEEYVHWDANETPFITFSAADPYGIDRGVELFGSFGPVHWITALTNGATGNLSDDDAGKSISAKVYGEPSRDLYLSGSVLDMGDTERSVFRLSGSTISPVGLDNPSSAGASPSDDVDTLCWELDAKVAEARRAHLGLQFGQAMVDDDVDAFDRDLTWFKVEPGFRLRDDLELVLRWSEIGTYDDDEGYRFSGKIIADAETFGYDTSVLRRVSGGLCWTMNPHVALKFEVGRDHVDLIDASSADAENDERLYVGLQLLGSF